MTNDIEEKRTKVFSKLNSYKKERLEELLFIMNQSPQVSGILLGGSLSYKDDFAKGDIDLFCLLDEAECFSINLHENLSILNDIDEIIFQGYFPWTEKLYTIYFTGDSDFSIDLCLIKFENAEKFFWEPAGIILFDKKEKIKQYRSTQMSSPEFTMQPFLKSNPFSLSVISLKKIEKNLSRNHLWNALEQLNSFRRYVMQIIRLKEIKHNDFLGRVDRDIEDVIPSEINNSLSKTVAIYNSEDIAEKTIDLIEIFLLLQMHMTIGNEMQFQIWILKQIKHEKRKLLTYCTKVTTRKEAL